MNDSRSAQSVGWRRLVDSFHQDKASYPIPAYSEFMPPPRVAITPFGEIDPALFSEDDPFGWRITEIEEEYQLKPGLDKIGRQVMDHLIKLGRGEPEVHIGGHEGQNLRDNPYWPPELAAHAGHLDHEMYVSFLPLALSRSQDDKGRVLWTCFGGSEQGPERVFWKGFYTSPTQEVPAGDGLGFFIRLLAAAYQESLQDADQLYSAGFRILPAPVDDSIIGAAAAPLPGWTGRYLVNEQSSFENVRYLLTFCPFSRLPGSVKERYFSGSLNLLPFPGSLALWGARNYQRLQDELPFATQIPLLQLLHRHTGPHGIRVPQSGWLHEPRPGKEAVETRPELLVHNFIRTHRWDRIHRFENELTHNPRVEKVIRVLFSTGLDVIGLYDKPMARNCQLWSHDFKMVLNGPIAEKKDIHRAEAMLEEGGLFGYRFQYPAMRAGSYDVYWHRPVVAYFSSKLNSCELLADAPLGYLTAYPASQDGSEEPLELWPRLLKRQAYLFALRDFENEHDHYAHETALNLVSLLDAWELLGEHPLERTFARGILRLRNDEELDEWIASLPVRARNPDALRLIQGSLAQMIEPASEKVGALSGITFSQTATRTFEVAYWNDIQFLSQGEYQNKDNADCVEDQATLSLLAHHHRDLERLGDYLIKRHQAAIQQAGLENQAFCGELPFRWQTDFDFPLFNGWKNNQERNDFERDILVVIPGKDHTCPVILGDHYDTAYMEDLYEPGRGGSGARKAAAGADDNHSATAVLLQAAPIYLELSRQGRLERDIWLVHLTGEEFPADCLGARHLSQALIEKNLRLHLEGDQWIDLSGARPAGIFVMDMIAHNRDDDQDIFQISPGKSRQSLLLARQAHLANQAWNDETTQWNHSPERRGLGPGRRSADGARIPAIARHLRLQGEVRTQDNPTSSLFNTDCQIFSDIGAPVVLFMENYDINRSGYHDTKDTLENIDLDYGAALAAIAIETVARVASLKSLE